MNFLVTGTNGFLGQHIIKFIKSLDGKILTIGRFHNKENSDTFLNIEDINKPVFNEVIKRFDPNYMFHIAGDAHPNNNKISDFVNFEFGLSLLKTLKQIGIDDKVKCIFFGTAAEYGKILPEMCPLKEDSFSNPISTYGKSKARQTKKAIEWSSNKRKLIVLRPFSILGERMPLTSAFGKFIAQIKSEDGSGLLKSGNLNVYRDYIDVNDLIDIMWKLINNSSSYGHVYNICQGKPVLLLNMVKYLLLKCNSDLKISNFYEKRIENDMSVIYGDNGKLKKIIGDFDFLDWKLSIDRILENLK
jgi:GDP-4-dehydro-6-deoxy-D-mannose reductase